MAYKNGNRNEATMFPPSIEDYVGKDDPVRVYDAFVETLDFEALGIEINEHQVGNSEYNPLVMMKLLLYGYAYGYKSSRKLERATHHNIAFIWLMGGMKPDHKTIAEYRRYNKNALRKVLKQSMQMCIKLELIEGNTLFLDGTKVRGNASLNKQMTAAKCHKIMEHADERIEKLLTQIEEVDDSEVDDNSWIKISEDLKNSQNLREKIKKVMEELEETKAESINMTDRDCVRIHGRQGSGAGYNAQLVVDDKNGLIVNSDVVSESNDAKQFAQQIEQANDNLDKKCEVACADAGYTDTKEKGKIDELGIKVIVPGIRQARKEGIKPFDKENFEYNKEQNCYTCPEGHKLSCIGKCENKGHLLYRTKNAAICRNCRRFGECTISQNGRRIRRLENEDMRLKLEKQYAEEASQVIYKRRKSRSEHPFGHMKRNLGLQAFLLRGLEGVKAEMAMYSTCFNLARVIGIMGVTEAIRRIII